MPPDGGSSGTGEAAPLAMQPDQTTAGALSQLVDALLDKGVYLDLDLLITVAEVPLVAINLRATIAGVETMIAYGLPGAWDDREAGRRGRTDEGSGIAEHTAPREVAWYREPRAGGGVWRAGTLRVESAVLHWVGDGDRRASLALDPAALRGARIRHGETPVSERVVLVDLPWGTAELAGESVERRVAEASRMASPTEPTREGSVVR